MVMEGYWITDAPSYFLNTLAVSTIDTRVFTN